MNVSILLNNPDAEHLIIDDGEQEGFIRLTIKEGGASDELSVDVNIEDLRLAIRKICCK
jgi:hypothetical protein